VQKSPIIDVSHTQVIEWLGVQSSNPPVFKEGDMYFNSTDNKIYIRANNLWISLN